jgi:hypothetical protein
LITPLISKEGISQSFYAELEMARLNLVSIFGDETIANSLSIIQEWAAVHPALPSSVPPSVTHSYPCLDGQ